MPASSRNKRVLLISDLHLEEARPQLTRAFLDFLDRETADASALYILGDFFNVWLGDDDDRPLNAVIANALKQCSDGGTAVYLLLATATFCLGPSSRVLPAPPCWLSRMCLNTRASAIY